MRGGGRGSRGGKKLWRCEVRPHLNPLPGGEEVASLCNPSEAPPGWSPGPFVARIHWHGGSAFAPPRRGDKPPRYAFDRGRGYEGIAGMTLRGDRGMTSARGFRRIRHLRARFAGTIHPGSESGTCFRSNCSCRLVPAHRGVKMGSGREVFGCHGHRPSPLDSRFRENDDWGAILQKLTYPGSEGTFRSNCPAGAGTPRWPSPLWVSARGFRPSPE